MADLPILFSTPMVRAILREIEHPGTGKTQTRRVLDAWCDEPPAIAYDGRIIAYDDGEREYRWPRTYAIDDRLYIREAHYRYGHWEPVARVRTKTGRQKWQFVEDRPDVLFDAPAVFLKGMHHKDPATPAWHIRQGRTMFRHHSRITLIVTDVRVQRLQEISETDAKAEGVFEFAVSRTMMANCHKADRDLFRDLWDSLNSSRGYGWDANPWVAAYTFRPGLGNIDQVQP